MEEELVTCPIKKIRFKIKRYWSRKKSRENPLEQTVHEPQLGKKPKFERYTEQVDFVRNSVVELLD